MMALRFLTSVVASVLLSGLAASTVAAEEAQAPLNLAVISERQPVAVAPEVVWKRAGGYCDIGAMLKTTCVLTSGTGDVGSNRLIAGRINEVLVAKTSTSYTYAQPMAPNLYHGTVEILPDGAGRSVVVYSLLLDPTFGGDPATRDAKIAERRGFLKLMLSKIKAASEAP
jgi:Polyketide cyclase / dehydrase and lipid transport